VTALAVRVDLECPDCAAPVAIAGMSGLARCGCGARLELGDDFLAAALRDPVDRRGEVGPAGRAWSDAGPAGRQRVALAVEAPRCGCGRPLPLDPLDGATGDEVELPCPCGEVTRARRRAPAARMGHPQARWLIGEHRVAPRLDGGGPIALWCPREGCRHGVAVDARADWVQCESCGMGIELERARWERLAGLPGARPFYLVLAPEVAAPPPPERYPLSPGWIATEVLLVPAMFAMIAVVALAGVAPVAATGVALAAGLLLTLRLPVLVRTLLVDRHLVLGADALRVPAIDPLRLRAWTLPWRQLAGVELTRERGSSTRVTLTLRDGRVRRFSATPLGDRHEVVRAIRARIGQPSGRQ
jgi:hypothetical protein